MVAMRQPLKDFFETNPLGWGATYHAHPVPLACAYECIKHMIKEDLPGRAAALHPSMVKGVQMLVDRHPTVRQGRAVGLFGAIDLTDAHGANIQPLQGPAPPAIAALKGALKEEGIYGLFRGTMMHCAPPLVITEDELAEGFARVDRALAVFDEAVLASKYY